MITKPRGGPSPKPRREPLDCIDRGDDIRDIWRAAQATITRYGDDAALHAAQRADELMAEGDMDGRAVWHRIERAIDELGRTAPGHGEGVH